MSEQSKSYPLRPAGAGRYGSFLSVGELLGIEVPRLQDTIKVQFLPQWGESPNHVDARLSKRSLLVDVKVSDVTAADIGGAATMAERVVTAVRQDSESLLEIVRAFGRSGSRAERKKAVDRAEQLGLYDRGDSEPVALWAGLLLVGAAILISGCCDVTDDPCEDDDNGGGGTGGPKPD